jgi:hypothetical protein
MGVASLVSHEPTLPESSGREDQLTEASSPNAPALLRI